MLKEEITVLGVVKFTAIVALDESNGEKEMHGHIALEVKENCVYIRFIA